MEDSDCHVKAKQIEWSLVAVANAGLGPHAVMVKLINAFSAGTAVRVAWSFPIIAFITPFRIVQIVWFRIFFLEFVHMAVDSHGLNVAPETHEHIEVAKICHQLSLEVTNQGVEVLN